MEGVPGVELAGLRDDPGALGVLKLRGVGRVRRRLGGRDEGVERRCSPEGAEKEDAQGE